MVEERYQNRIYKVHELPEADLDSDHNLFIAVVEIKLKKL